MADLSPNRTRIVPIMAGRTVTTKPASNDANQAPPKPARPVRKTRNSNKQASEAELLKIACLEPLSLYALPTKGDGNCLYYALSDQLYGEWDRAGEIRAQVAEHMKTNREYFINFTAAIGGERRAPRRAAAAAARSSGAYIGPIASSKEVENKFEAKVADSQKNGVWGGSEEIQAFCQFYGRDVRVYTDAGIQTFRDVNAPAREERELVHIAFHSFDHYSSVRNVDGPHTGLPCIPNSKSTGVVKLEDGSPTSDTGFIIDVVTPWKISFIQEGLGGRYDQDTIVEMLRQCRGDIDRAFANLLDDADSQSSSNATASSPSASNTTASSGPPSIPPDFKSLLPSSRSSSRHSNGSKRSANDDSDDEGPRNPRRSRGREQKRRILPNVTVGIAFRDERRNDLVSLRLRVNPEAVVDSSSVDVLSDNADSVTSEKPTDGRKLRTRKQSTPSVTVTESEDSFQSSSAEARPIPEQKAARASKKETSK